MSTFYVLPPRECLEHAAAEFLARLIPGLPAEDGLCERLLGTLTADRDLYIVHREELSGHADPADELADVFGAEPGDRVVEVGPAVGSRPAPVRVWTMPGAVPVGRAG